MRLSERRGITLVETMIAMFILTFVMAAALGAFLLGRFAVMDAKHRVKAMNLLRDKMEWVRSQSASAVEGWIGAPIVENNVDDSVGTNELLNDTRTTTASYVYIGSDKMLKVLITLNWEKRRLGGTSVKGDGANPDERVVTLICP